MANWAYVENGEIKKLYDSLPTHWECGTTSHVGFHLSINNLTWLKEQGWYPVVKQEITFNENLSYITKYNYIINQDDVTEVPVIQDYSDEEIEKIKKNKLELLLNDIRGGRNERLKNSDWTQGADIQEQYSDEWKQAWKSYRQQLRDLPSTITPDGYFTWPSEPNVAR